MCKNTRTAWATIAVVLAVIAIPALMSVKASAQEQTQPYPFYPCTSCHQAMQLTGDRKAAPFHGIDLTKGAHRGLFCSNCHTPPAMIDLVNGAKVYIPGLHDTEKLKETNKVCAVCHPRVVKDYNYLVHGNTTYICQGGNVTRVIGYKGVGYTFHICPEYKNLKTVPAKACVECHDPHDPTMPPASILPAPSERPAPPDETSIAYGTLAAVIGGLALVVGALVLPLGYSRE
ncbi:MAG TPA: hypothetical protein EYP33_01055 [Pyrodictium sp.]|nr:hypothetical protein [Pyrodictium sp.]